MDVAAYGDARRLGRLRFLCGIWAFASCAQPKFVFKNLPGPAVQTNTRSRGDTALVRRLDSHPMV